VVNYTVGQRRGLPARGGGEPLYVLGVDAEANVVTVGPHEGLMSSALVADELSFIAGGPPSATFEARARIRYRGEPAAATVRVTGAKAEVRFARPQRAVTPGQAVVFYDGDRVLGGGTIVRALGD
jgi:tRNA-specific 2-thiouridylase